jgi:hypothetical protein
MARCAVNDDSVRPARAWATGAPTMLVAPDEAAAEIADAVVAKATDITRAIGRWG